VRHSESTFFRQIDITPALQNTNACRAASIQLPAATGAPKVYPASGIWGAGKERELMSMLDPDSQGRASSRKLPVDADALLASLTTLQHVYPHKALRAVIGETRACPVAAERAIEWLGLDGDIAIGRLKRTELIQLARSLHRFWRKATAGDAVPAV
jgi:hypothetical protein